MGKAKKKTRIVGVHDFMDMKTGEIHPMNIVMEDEPDKDANFYKLFLKDTLNALEIVSNSKTKVAYWLIDHMNSNNQLIYTYRQIANECGYSYQTVANTIKILKDADFLRTSGKILIINPSMIYKGTAKRRAAVMKMYANSEAGDEEASIDARIDNLNDSIARLTKQVEKLKKEKDDAAQNGNNAANNSVNATAITTEINSDNSENDSENNSENQEEE